MVKKIKDNKKILIIYGLIFLGFALLAYLIPYAHDDWAWGSEVGIERLQSNFIDYNGRYFGNYLILALTRSRFLWIISIACAALLMCSLPTFLSKRNTVLLTVFSLVLLLLMPKDIFVQTLAWASGYSNYLPPVLTTVIYFVLINNVFEKENPAYKAVTPLFTAVLGIVGALFMEHVTLYNLAISFLIIIFVFAKHKKLYFTHIAFAAGTALGTIIMFTNSAYGLIANSSDAQGGYRSTALGGSLVSILKTNLKIICEQLFIKNIPLLAVLSILLVVITLFRLKRRSKNKQIMTFSLFVNIFTFMILFVKSKYQYWFITLDTSDEELITLIFLVGVIGLYCLSVLALTVLCVRNLSMMFKMLLTLISVVIVTAPLAVVSPVSARCFIPQYFFLSIYCVLMLSYIERTVRIEESVQKILTVTLSAIMAAVCVFTFNIYAEIHHYAQKRDEYLQKQISSGETTVKFCEIPNSTYLHHITPVNDMWEYRYKLFYNIDPDIKFEKMYYKDFDEWAKEYDKKEEVK